MANVGAAIGQQVLNWMNGGGAAVTAGTGRYVAVGLVAPSSTNGQEVATGSGMTRQTIAFSAAASPTNTAGNSVAATLGPNSALGTYLGASVWDTGPGTVGLGTLVWYNTLTTSRTLAGGDSLVFAVGSLQTSMG